VARPGTFPKGHSGNRKGRPKEDVNVKELCRAHTVEAVDCLVNWMRSDHPKASPAAAMAILSRAWGMPKQEHEHTGADGAALIPSITVTVKDK
jgi:hypothetical protein